MSEIRYDAVRCDLSRARRTPSGGLAVPAYISRVGCQTYDSGVEYRPPDEVFSVDSLSSFRAAPITVGHPVDVVTPETWKTVAVGQTGDDVRRDGDEFVAATIYIQDEETISRVMAKQLIELSCGYHVDLEMTPGQTPDGTKYDAIQRNIRGNHIALLPPGGGRAGSDVSLKIDEKDEKLMKFAIRFDNKIHEFDAESDAVVEVVRTLQEKLAAAEQRADAAEKRADDTQRISELVAERMKIVETAKKLVPDIVVDGKTNNELILECISKKDTSFVSGSEDPEYARGLFFGLASVQESKESEKKSDEKPIVVAVNDEKKIDFSPRWEPTPLMATNRRD